MTAATRGSSRDMMASYPPPAAGTARGDAIVPPADETVEPASRSQFGYQF